MQSAFKNIPYTKSAAFKIELCISERKVWGLMRGCTVWLFIVMGFSLGGI